MIYILCNFTAYFMRLFMQKTVKQNAVYLHNTISGLGYILGNKYHLVALADYIITTPPPPLFLFCVG